MKPGASDKAVAGIQARVDGSSDLHGVDEDGEKCPALGYILEELLTSLRN